jgi:hypothetical protein
VGSGVTKARVACSAWGYLGIRKVTKPGGSQGPGLGQGPGSCLGPKMWTLCVTKVRVACSAWGYLCIRKVTGPGLVKCSVLLWHVWPAQCGIIRASEKLLTWG